MEQTNHSARAVLNICFSCFFNTSSPPSAHQFEAFLALPIADSDQVRCAPSHCGPLLLATAVTEH
jgi:hypothetical protein